MENVEKKIWVITDTHFNHKRIAEYTGRPDNYNELIVENWSKLVGKDDLTIHLGDVIFSRAGELGSILSKIPGKKILVRGNHDMNRDDWYLKHGFDFTCDQIIKKGMVFSHIPVAKIPGTWINIHGHLHNTPHRAIEDEIRSIYDRSYHRLVAIENVEYKPVLLQDLISLHRAELELTRSMERELLK